MSGVQSIERAFAILRQLALGPAGVTDLAERTELPKSTVSRLLSALESQGAVERRDQGGDYTIAAGLADIADAASVDANLAAVVRPFLVELSEATGETVGFVVRTGRQVYWVDNLEVAGTAVQVKNRTGFYAPMHAVPAGLAVLAHLPADEIDAYLDAPLEELNDRTITDPDELRSRLDEIATAGLVWSLDDLGEGITAIDVPFRGSHGDVEGALFVNAPSYRFPASGDRQRIEKIVLGAAEQLSRRLAVH